VVRRSIQQLSAALVNRIAAGEVIERPASVVKELVENSLDAGAKNIAVEIEDGGRALIRIIDDGSGIPPAELPLAFAPHATSKLVCDEDLAAISTLGFRGEALASIGAVSQARILSRTAADPAAYEVINHGGVIDQPQAAAGNVGTVVEVRNLFFNTPARRKFIKGSPTEFGHISETLLRLALPFPEVSFKLMHNGKVSLDLPATTPTERLLCAWPDDFHELRLPINARDAELAVGGIVGLPELARPTAKYQYIFLNGRPIRDKFIQHGLREAYRGLTEPGRYPAAILLLSIPPADVDVNVHPTKSEVRFRDSGRIHGLILSSVREILLGSDLTPAAMARPMLSPMGFSPGNAPARADMRQRLAEFFRGPLPTAGTGSAEQNAGAIPNTSGMAAQSFGGGSSTSSFGSLPPGSSQDGSPSGGSTPTWGFNPPAPIQARLPEGNQNFPAIGSGAGSNANPANSPAAPAIQLHNSYLVAESEDGLIIIDQHALHERIMYEDLYARVSRGPLESQRLLIPPTIPASPRQLELLEQVQPLLLRLGIEAAAFGPGSAAIHSFPTFLGRLEPADFLTELLERGEQELLDLHEEELLHGILDMMACKAAVKAGDPLSAAEIEALLARRHLIDRSSNCPHGRPTTLRLTLRDLEKQFKRTGF
jgi:DNA mismatch repair protein MutL